MKTHIFIWSSCKEWIERYFLLSSQLCNGAIFITEQRQVSTSRLPLWMGTTWTHERLANQKTVFQISTNHDGRNYFGHNAGLYMKGWLAIALLVAFDLFWGLVEFCLAENLMKIFEILCNSTPDLACRNVLLKTGKVSLFLADSVSFTWLAYLIFWIFCQPQRK